MISSFRSLKWSAVVLLLAGLWILGCSRESVLETPVPVQTHEPRESNVRDLPTAPEGRVDGPFVPATHLEPSLDTPTFKPVMLLTEGKEKGRRALIAAGFGQEQRVELTPNLLWSDKVAVSEDGRWAAYTRKLDSGGTRLCTVEVASGDRRCWDSDQSEFGDIAWKPKTHLLWAKIGDKLYEIPVNQETAPVKVMKDRLALASDLIPAFSPDGRWGIWRTHNGIRIMPVNSSDGNPVIRTGEGRTWWLDESSLLMEYSKRDGNVHYSIETLEAEGSAPLPPFPEMIPHTLQVSGSGRHLATLYRQPGQQPGEGEDIGYPGPIGVVVYDRRTGEWQVLEDGGKPWTSPQAQRVLLLGWSMDGKFLAVGSSAGEVHVYNTETERWSALE